MAKSWSGPAPRPATTPQLNPLTVPQPHPGRGPHKSRSRAPESVEGGEAGMGRRAGRFMCGERGVGGGRSRRLPGTVACIHIKRPVVILMSGLMVQLVRLRFLVVAYPPLHQLLHN